MDDRPVDDVDAHRERSDLPPAHVRALLVGIDDYQAVTKLSGCVADIEAIAAMLRKRIDSHNLDLVMLRNGEATRANIIATFRSHLGSAAADEVALFYYAGHGSQEPCPPEWARLESDGLNETIVCVDSRSPGIWDLADKEINALIAEAGANGARVVTIFDSCHSGGVTRDAGDAIATGARFVRAAQERRPLADFLDAAQERYSVAVLAMGDPPDPPHVALAACQPHQTAKELPMGSIHRGAFSFAFEECLSLIGDGATYVDLTTAIRTRLRSQVDEQTPDLLAAGGVSVTTSFLGDSIVPRHLTADADHGVWWLSAGAVDGVTDPGAGGSIEVSLSEHDSAASGSSRPVADATVATVEPTQARLNVTLRSGATLDPTRQYVAVITKVAVPSIRVIVTGEGAADVAAAIDGCSPLALVTITPPTSASGIRDVTATTSGATVTLQGAGAPAVLPFTPTDRDSVLSLRAAVAHLATWHSMLDRQAPTSALATTVSVDILTLDPGTVSAPDGQAPAESVGDVVTLDYVDDTAPRAQIRLTNAHDERLYVALLDLTDSYGSGKLFGDWIAPGVSGWARQAAVQKFVIPPWLSAEACSDRLKLIASTVEFDADAWIMPRLLGDRKRGDNSRGDDREVLDEELQDPDDPDEHAWGTSLVTIVTRRSTDPPSPEPSATPSPSSTLQVVAEI